jgi:tetraacyldisaccharide 4'-kinase
MVILKILLLPFAALYKLITDVRNRLFDLGLKPSVQFDLPVIAVGNLTVGGTGKSPLIEHLIRLLSQKYKVATLSRGFGRKTKGMHIASSVDNATTLGDEPMQFYRKFSDQITVAVGEDRVFAIPNILHQFPETQVVLLDDAYQHRYVKPSFNILLSDYNRPFYNDLLLPAGRLRESRSGASRADVVVITKCPQTLTGEKMIAIEKSVRKYTVKPIFFTKVRYGFPVPFAGAPGTICDKVILVSGIANADPLEEYVKSNFEMVKHVVYGDHYQYTLSSIKALVALVKANPGTSILTTEKDMVKIDSTEFLTLTSHVSMFYLPIEVEFLKDGEDFDEMVLGTFTTSNDK